MQLYYFSHTLYDTST